MAGGEPGDPKIEFSNLPLTRVCAFRVAICVRDQMCQSTCKATLFLKNFKTSIVQRKSCLDFVKRIGSDIAAY
jgi:hypothetical protein